MSDQGEDGFSRGAVLVVAFEGWNDAGEAASGAARAIRDQFRLQPVAAVDPEDYFDFQFNRPMVSTGDDGERVLEWPGVTLYGAGEGSTLPASGIDVHVLLGTEPSRGWKTFTAEMIDAIETAGITAIVFLGAMLADVPHTRPISVFASSDNEAVRDRYELERSGYEGPVGIISVLAIAAERAGIPTMTIWASVPHYVHNAPSPKATLALIERAEEFVDLDIARDTLQEESAEWESGIDALAEDDDDMRAYIAQLEQARDTVDAPEASGEAIAEEFERYLRRRDGRDGPAGSR